MPQILLLYSSRKGGHRFPALGLAAALKQQQPAWNIKIVNFLDIIPLADNLDRFGRWGDLHLTRVWRHGFRRLHRGEPGYTGIFRLFLASVLANPSSRRRWCKAIGTADFIISFQPEVNCISAWLKKEFPTPLHTLVMDLVPHAGWVNQHIDYYYAVSDITRQELIRHDAPAERVMVTGAPVQPGLEAALNRSMAEQRQQLGLEKNLTTLLVMAGYLGTMVDYQGIINRLLNLDQPWQILVLTGRNRDLFHVLKQHPDPRLKVYYDVPSIHPLLRSADLVISKPGGMVITDALAHGKPMILIDPNAGSLQEVLFADLMEKQKAAIHLQNLEQIGEKVLEVINDPGQLRRMADICEDLGRKNRTASRFIARHIIQRLG